MKKIKNKIKIIMIFLLVLTMIRINIVRADNNEENDTLEDRERTVAEKDTYVDLRNYNTNYGGQDYLKVGRWYIYSLYESYLYFEFENEPDNWKEVEISLNILSVSETMKMEIYLIKVSWNELTLTWINKPNKSELIKTLTITEDDIYKFKITDEVEDLLDRDKEGISICISTNITQPGDFWIRSSEGYRDKDDAPLLIWTYDIIPDDIDEIIYLIVIIIIGLVILVIIVLIIKYIKKEKIKSKESVPIISLKFCVYCSKQISQLSKFCIHCGKQRPQQKRNENKKQIIEQ